MGFAITTNSEPFRTPGAFLSGGVVICGCFGLFVINWRSNNNDYHRERLHSLILTIDCVALMFCVGGAVVSERSYSRNAEEMLIGIVSRKGPFKIRI